MLRHFIEYAVFKEFKGKRLRDLVGGSYLQILNRIEGLPPDGYLENHPETLPNYHEKIAVGLRAAEARGEPEADTRCILLLVEGLLDYGRFVITANPSKYIWQDGDIITNPDFHAELEIKTSLALTYLTTDPLEWWRKLLPITHDVMDLMITESRVFYSLSPPCNIGGIAG